MAASRLTTSSSDQSINQSSVFSTTVLRVVFRGARRDAIGTDILGVNSKGLDGEEGGRSALFFFCTSEMGVGLI